MTAEICAAKLIETQFGISIYVWAAVLSITMLGLAAGYFIGGRLSKRAELDKLVGTLVSAAGFLLILMPIIAQSIMPFFQSFNLLLGTILSCAIFLLPLMFVFGCISPTLVEIGASKKQAGKVAGEIYGLSTVSGVLSILFVTLVLMPLIGISKTCFVFGAILLTIGILFSVRRKMILTILGILIVTGSYSIDKQILAPNRVQSIYNSTNTFNGIPLLNMNILYDSEGLFGRVSVVDMTVKYGTVVGDIRGLIVNNSWQTLVSLSNWGTMFDYVFFMDGIVDHFTQHKDVLHIGLGGGYFCKKLLEKGKNITAVELDGRILKVARKYFRLPPSLKVEVEDGRRFINNSKESYDLIILNAFNSVILPWNLFTLESFEKCYELTRDNGVLIVEIGGYLEGNDDVILSSIMKTIKEAGWNTTLVKTKNSDLGDFICIAYKSDFLDVNSIQYKSGNSMYRLSNHIIPPSSYQSASSIVFSDDNPILTKWSSDRIQE